MRSAFADEGILKLGEIVKLQLCYLKPNAPQVKFQKICSSLILKDKKSQWGTSTFEDLSCHPFLVSNFRTRKIAAQLDELNPKDLVGP